MIVADALTQALADSRMELHARANVVATGAIRALRAPTERWRPAPGGVSIGHARITAGTLGCVVHRDNEMLLLSNNHVFADSNAGVPGDPIVQPGPIDDGTEPDFINRIQHVFAGLGVGL